MDWKKKCVVCMNLPGKIPVFGSLGRKENIEGMIADFLDITVEESEGSPERICEACYNTLHRANEMKESARRSTQKLELFKLFEEDERAEAELESLNEPASKPAPWKPYVDDDILYERITTSCDLKEFKKHIPFVKLERVDDPEWHVKWPQFPESQISTQEHFTLYGPDTDIFEH